MVDFKNTSESEKNDVTRKWLERMVYDETYAFLHGNSCDEGSPSWTILFPSLYI